MNHLYFIGNLERYPNRLKSGLAQAYILSYLRGFQVRRKSVKSLR